MQFNLDSVRAALEDARNVKKLEEYKSKLAAREKTPKRQRQKEQEQLAFMRHMIYNKEMYPMLRRPETSVPPSQSSRADSEQLAHANPSFASSFASTLSNK